MKSIIFMNKIGNNIDLANKMFLDHSLNKIIYIISITLPMSFTKTDSIFLCLTYVYVRSIDVGIKDKGNPNTCIFAYSTRIIRFSSDHND